MIKDRRGVTVDVLYGDGDGGQRAITRFSLAAISELQPAAEDVDDWLVSVLRRRNLDGPDPRER